MASAFRPSRLAAINLAYIFWAIKYCITLCYHQFLDVYHCPILEHSLMPGENELSYLEDCYLIDSSSEHLVGGNTGI